MRLLLSAAIVASLAAQTALADPVKLKCRLSDPVKKEPVTNEYYLDEAKGTFAPSKGDITFRIRSRTALLIQASAYDAGSIWEVALHRPTGQIAIFVAGVDGGELRTMVLKGFCYRPAFE